MIKNNQGNYYVARCMKPGQFQGRYQVLLGDPRRPGYDSIFGPMGTKKKAVAYVHAMNRPPKSK